MLVFRSTKWQIGEPVALNKNEITLLKSVTILTISVWPMAGCPVFSTRPSSSVISPDDVRRPDFDVTARTHPELVTDLNAGNTKHV